MTVALLIYTNRSPGQPVTAEPESDILDRHRALQAELAEQGRLMLVSRLEQPERRHQVTVDTVVRDGPYLETKEWLVGFYLVDAPDLETAEGWARRICVPGDTWVEVRKSPWHRGA